MSEPGSISVVVMAYNEAESLEGVVRELAAALAALTPAAAHELVIVDDGSLDGTGALADRLAVEVGPPPRVRVIHHPQNRGLGGVYRTGFEVAEGELLTFFPADGQFPASILHTFHPMMAEHDLVLGYLPRRSAAPLSIALSVAEKILYRVLFGPMPRFQGVFMIRRAVLDSLTLHTRGRGWGVVMEMLLRVARAGHRVASVPTPFRPRRTGRSKVVDPRTIWINLRQALELRRTLRR
jgi:glycosyltransferase involved in cell wall biosynthesis